MIESKIVMTFGKQKLEFFSQIMIPYPKDPLKKEFTNFVNENVIFHSIRFFEADLFNI